jgi:hypothetical protein
MPQPTSPRYPLGMCIICIDLAKKAITPAEGRRNLREMTEKLDKEHLREVEAKLTEAEQEQKQTP